MISAFLGDQNSGFSVLLGGAHQQVREHEAAKPWPVSAHSHESSECWSSAAALLFGSGSVTCWGVDHRVEHAAQGVELATSASGFASSR
jgi:hypothetical protein